VRYVCLVGSSEDGLRLRQRLSSVPGRTRPSAGGAFAPCFIAVGPGCGFGWRRSLSRPQQRGSSSPSVVATGSVLDLPQLLRLGMGRAQSDIAFSPQLRFRPGGGCAGVEPARWRWRRGERSQLPKAGVVLAVGLVLYGGGLFISLYTTKPV
jgi:hypothetical protein